MCTENNEKLIKLGTDELVAYWSNTESINGILREKYNGNDGRTEIRLIITYTDLAFESDMYFGFVRKLEEMSEKTNIRVIINFIASIEFGLLGIHLLEKGQSNCCDFLINGEILFDRTGKYNELKKIAKRIASPKVLRRARTPYKLGLQIK